MCVHDQNTTNALEPGMYALEKNPKSLRVLPLAKTLELMWPTRI